jgi:hypothetical protein
MWSTVMNNLIPHYPKPHAEECQKKPCPPPACFKEVVELAGSALERKLGYFGNARFVVFSFHPMASEVIWNDGRSSGLGGGGWQAFLTECVPAARQVGAHLGSRSDAGSEVLLLDRTGGTTYAVPRECAEEFLARENGRPLPTHRCLCGMKDTQHKE